jgi:hypothetical protein
MLKEHPNFTYTGEIKHNSIPHGEGKLIGEEGCIMFGTWKSGKLVKGVAHRANGPRLDGEFDNGKLIKGIINYADGARDEGDFLDGILVKGIHHSANGTRKEGEYNSGKLIKGTINFANGTREDGIRNGTKLIKGVINFANGSRVEGNRNNGKLVDGIINGALGYREEGKFQNNILIKGVRHAVNGERNDGDFHNGIIIKGTIHYAAGGRACGEFKEDRSISMGIMDSSNGDRKIINNNMCITESRKRARYCYSVNEIVVAVPEMVVTDDPEVVAQVVTDVPEVVAQVVTDVPEVVAQVVTDVPEAVVAVPEVVVAVPEVVVAANQDVTIISDEVKSAIEKECLLQFWQETQLKAQKKAQQRAQYRVRVKSRAKAREIFATMSKENTQPNITQAAVAEYSQQMFYTQYNNALLKQAAAAYSQQHQPIIQSQIPVISPAAAAADVQLLTASYTQLQMINQENVQMETMRKTAQEKIKEVRDMYALQPKQMPLTRGGNAAYVIFERNLISKMKNMEENIMRAVVMPSILSYSILIKLCELIIKDLVKRNEIIQLKQADAKTVGDIAIFMEDISQNL